jgi:hypothetical protein
MGINNYILLSHDLHPFDDRSLVLARFQRTLPEALALREFFRSVGGETHDREVWNVQGGEYRGPGGLCVEVRPNIAVVKGSRWNGFWRNKPQRTVQLSAYRSIARALSSPMMVVCADDDCAEFLDWNNTQDAIIAGLRAERGPPALSLDAMEDLTTEEIERWDPPAWYLGVPPRSLEAIESTIVSEPAWYMENVAPS